MSKPESLWYVLNMYHNTNNTATAIIVVYKIDTFLFSLFPSIKVFVLIQATKFYTWKNNYNLAPFLTI